MPKWMWAYLTWEGIRFVISIVMIAITMISIGDYLRPVCATCAACTRALPLPFCTLSISSPVLVVFCFSVQLINRYRLFDRNCKN